MTEVEFRLAAVEEAGTANVPLGIRTELIELGIAVVTQVGAAIAATGTGT